MPRALRWLALYLPPLAVGAVNLFHPVGSAAEPISAVIAARLNWWLALHVLNLMLFPSLGLTLWLLLAERRGLAAAVSRAILLIYVPLYAGFDALVGLGTGLLVQHTAGLPAAEQAAFEPAINLLFDSSLSNTLAVVGSIAWMVAGLGAAIAFTAPARRAWATAMAFIAFGVVGWALNTFGTHHVVFWAAVAGSVLALAVVARPPVAALLLASSAFLFGSGHYVPLGPLAMLCLLGGVALCQAVPVPQPAPVLLRASQPGAD